MAFFGSKKTSVLEQVINSSWHDQAERDALFKQVREAGLSSKDIIPLLFHNDLVVRQLGGEIFLTKPDAASVNMVIEQSADKPQGTRGWVFTRLLARVPDDLLQKVVDDLLGDRNPMKQRQGWEVALNLQGELKRKYLERAVTEAPVVMRAPALQRLLQEFDPTPFVALLLTQARDTDPRMAGIAQEALVRIRDPRVFDLMLDRFAHGDATSQQRAMLYLREAARQDPAPIRKKMMELLGAGEDAIRHQAVQLLFETGGGDEVLTEILLFSRDLVGWLRSRILETLRNFGDRVFESALTLLQHPEEDVRTTALVLAENFKDPRLIEPVGRMLDDDDWWLRITACDTLGRLGDEAAVPYLIKALEDQDTRWAAIDGLAQLASPAALRPLASLLKDPRSEVRLEVIRALAAFADPRLLPLLQQVKERDASSEVRTRASEVLRDLSEKLHREQSDSEQGTMAVSSSQLSRPLDKLLAIIREQECSDLHITVDEPPLVRANGELKRLDGYEPIPSEKAREWILEILDPKQKKAMFDRGELDFCYSIPEVGRYRANAFVQRRGMCATFRVIPNIPPTFAELRMPGRLTELLDYHQGLIVVSGPAGSGKSTTLAAIVNLINETKPDHVITLEDPIEFVHPVKTALVNQREVGRHTNSFARALRAALREDPDVIMVGEMRDADTIRLALTAAETGHLVIGTLHTTSAVQTVERLIKSFPPDEQPQVRIALSESLKYVVCQNLLPKKGGKGRVAAFEVLKGTLNVGNLIRDNKTYQLTSSMQTGRRQGMQTKDVALMDLVEGGLITAETAWRRADKPENFEALCDPGFLAQKGASA